MSTQIQVYKETMGLDLNGLDSSNKEMITEFITECGNAIVAKQKRRKMRSWCLIHSGPRSLQDRDLA